MTNQSDESMPQNPVVVKDRLSLVLLVVVVLAVVGCAWLFGRNLVNAPNIPPPLLPIVLSLIGALGLLVGRDRHERLVATPAALPPESEEVPVVPQGGVAYFSSLHVAVDSLPAGVSSWQLLALSGSLLLTILLLLRIPEMQLGDSYFGVFLSWLIAIGLFVVAVAPLRPEVWRQWPEQARALWREQRLLIVLLAIVTLGALLLRVVNLGTLPQTLGGDEGSQGLEAVRVLRREIRNPFSTGWLGVPTMSFFFNSITIGLFGASNAALRLPWALTGTATVLATFFLTRRLTHLPLALMTTVLVAVYHYHIHYSRLGSNQVADPFFVVLALLFLYRALDHNRPGDWALTGIICALGLYFYAGARLTPVVVGAVLLYYLLRERQQFMERRLAGVFVLIGAFLVVAAPMLQYAVRFPGDFNARLNQVGIFQSGWLEREVVVRNQSTLTILADQFRRAVLAYNYYPDRTVWYGLRTPLLDPFFGALFLLGLLYGTLRMWGNTRDWRLAPMVAWWWGGIILGGMLTESPPSSQRLITTSVPACFFIALAVWEVLSLAETAVSQLPKRILAAVTVAVFAVISLQGYFLDFTPQRLYGGRHAELATDLAPLLNELSDTHHVFFFGPPAMYWGFATIPYMAPDMPGQDVIESLQAPPPPTMLPPGRDALFIFMPHRLSELELVRQTFPGGEVRELYSEVDGVWLATLYIAPAPQ